MSEQGTKAEVFDIFLCHNGEDKLGEVFQAAPGLDRPDSRTRHTETLWSGVSPQNSEFAQRENIGVTAGFAIMGGSSREHAPRQSNHRVHDASFRRAIERLVRAWEFEADLSFRRGIPS